MLPDDTSTPPEEERTDVAAATPVVFVIGVLEPRRGMEVALLELASALAQERPVEIVLVHGPDPGTAPVPVTALPPRGRVRRARALRAVLARRPEATVVLTGLWAAAHVAVAAPAAVPRAVGWEHSLTARRLRDSGPRTRLRMHVAGRAYRRARAAVAVSEEVAVTLRATWRVDPVVIANLLPSERARAIDPSGTDPHRTDPGRTDPHRTDPGRTDPDGTDRVRLLTVGALNPTKNHPLILRALALLPRTWTLTVAGAGPDHDQLRELSDALGVQDRVTWLGHVDDVEAQMARADVLLQPSTTETFGYALFEAGAAHLPVVALDVPVVRDVVPALAPGLLVDDPTPESFARAVRQAVTRTRAGTWAFAAADEQRRTRFGREEVLAAWRRVLD